MTIPLKDQITEVGRELGLRKNVYARFVKSGRMSQAESDMHMERLDAVYRTLKWLEKHREQILAAATLAEVINEDLKA